MDKKRGQVTLFVILGIVIVAIILLVVFLREPIAQAVASEANLQTEMKGVTGSIEKCLKKSADGPIKKIAWQGGYLGPTSGTYRLWNDTTVSYLCYNMKGKQTCINRLLTVKVVEKQLEKAIEEKLKTCVDIQPRGTFAKYDVITKKDFNVTVQVLLDAVRVNLDYPVTLQSKKTRSNVLSKQKFTSTLSYPLGDLLNVVYSIIDAETTNGYFDQLSYMLASQSKYTIYVNKPYPDKIYRLKLRENDFTFQFAVEGEPSS